MLQHYVKVVLRALGRDRFYAGLNVLGLVVGLTGFLVLAVFVRNEVTYDRFHRDPDRVYRLTSYYQMEGRESRYALVTGHLDGLVGALPEVEAITTLFKVQQDLVFRHGDRAFTEGRGFYTDADFFRVFTFALRAGDPATALQAPDAVVLSDALARKYFGGADPVGQVLEWVGPEESRPLKVTGVLAPLPANSHLQFDFLLAGALLGDFWQELSAPASSPMAYVYLRTRGRMAPAALQRRVDAATEAWKRTRLGEPYRSGQVIARHPVQPLPDLYFHADHAFEPMAGGNLAYVRLLGAVAVLMLVVAAINYVNLTTARSARRAREVGVRKVLGSSSAALAGRFLLEAGVMGLVAAVLSAGAAELVLRGLLPALLGLRLSLVAEPALVLAGVGVGVGVGVLAGVVPALGVARLRLVDALKGRVGQGRERLFGLRDVLVTLQFAVTVCLLAGALVLLRQLDYLEARGLGYRQEHVVTVNYSRSERPANWQAFREAAARVPGVRGTGACLYPPVSDQSQATVFAVGASGSTEPVTVAWNAVSYDFVPTMGVAVVEGRAFSREHPADAQGLVINEAARRALGVEAAVGMKLRAWFTPPEGAPVIGVVKDYHFQSFDQAIMPLVLRMDPESERILVARLDGGAAAPALARLEAAWRQAGMVAPFAYTFLDDHFQQLLLKEARLSRLLVAFTVVSLVIAGLGLVGLVGYVTERRRKEIGIRKVMGASRLHLVALLNRRFAGAVVVAFAAAVPLAWGVLQRWLDGFAYRQPLSWEPFALAGVAVLAAAVLTVSIQSFRAASADPVKSLRYE